MHVLFQAGALPTAVLEEGREYADLWDADDAQVRTIS